MDPKTLRTLDEIKTNIDSLIRQRNAAQNAIAALVSEITRYREALEPFARYAKILDRSEGMILDACPIATRPSRKKGELFVSDLRRARDVLRGLNPELERALNSVTEEPPSCSTNP